MLIGWQYQIQWDKISRQEATKVLFKWHVHNHDWNFDGKNTTGLYRVKIGTAWHYNVTSHAVFANMRPKLDYVDRLSFLRCLSGDFGKTVCLCKVHYPEDASQDALKDDKKGECNEGRWKTDLETLQKLQTRSLDLVFKLRTFQPAISRGELSDMKSLNKVRHEIKALEKEAESLYAQVLARDGGNI